MKNAIAEHVPTNMSGGCMMALACCRCPIVAVAPRSCLPTRPFECQGFSAARMHLAWLYGQRLKSLATSSFALPSSSFIALDNSSCQDKGSGCAWGSCSRPPAMTIHRSLFCIYDGNRPWLCDHTHKVWRTWGSLSLHMWVCPLLIWMGGLVQWDDESVYTYLMDAQYEPSSMSDVLVY